MQVRRSLLINFLNSNANTAAMFVVALFLARWLTPAQVGAFSIGVVVINLASVFRDLGALSFLVQKQHLKSHDAGSVLGLLTFTSWVLAVILWLTAPLLAEYFNQPDITSILHILTISFLLVPLAGVMSALLIRDLRAEKSAIVVSAGTVAFCITSMVLAGNGFGAETLAWANLANVATNVAGYWIFRPRQISLRPLFQGWRQIIKYGGGIAANNLSTVANQSVPDLVIGRMVGSHAVGVYSRGNGLVSLYQQAVSPTLNYNVMPYVAHSGQSRAQMANQLSKAGAYLSVTSWPVYGFLAVFAEPVLELLYGQQWLEAAPLVGILCIAGAVRSPVLHLSLALQAVDRSWAAAIPNIAALLARAIAVLVAQPQGLVELAWCLLAGDVVNTGITLYLAGRHLGLGYRALIGHQSRSAMVSCGCFAACVLYAWIFAALPSLVTMLIAIPLVASTWLGMIFAFRHACSEEVSGMWSKLRST